MVASVQELILAAQSKAKRSPFSQLADIINGASEGYSEGLKIRDANIQNKLKVREAASQDELRRAQIAQQLVEIQQKKEQTEAMREQAKLFEQDMAQKSEMAVREGQAATAPISTPPTPAGKFERQWSVDEQGRKSYKMVKTPEPKQPEIPNTLGEIAAQRVREGKMTLEDAYKLDNEGKGGVSPSLVYQMEKDKKKEETDIKELQVPGYTLGSNVRPTQKEASDLRAGSGAMADFTKGVDRMISLINENGSTELTGTVSGEMASLAANLKLTLKEVQKLGVLSASDIAFLEAQIVDPSSIKSAFIRKGTAIKQLETARDRAKSLTEEATKARGYIKAGDDKNNQTSTVKKSPEQRYSELESQNMSPEDIYKTLAKEGY